MKRFFATIAIILFALFPLTTEAGGPGQQFNWIMEWGKNGQTWEGTSLSATSSTPVYYNYFAGNNFVTRSGTFLVTPKGNSMVLSAYPGDPYIVRSFQFQYPGFGNSFAGGNWYEGACTAGPKVTVDRLSDGRMSIEIANTTGKKLYITHDLGTNWRALPPKAKTTVRMTVTSRTEVYVQLRPQLLSWEQCAMVFVDPASYP